MFFYQETSKFSRTLNVRSSSMCSHIKLDVFTAQMSDPHPGVLMVEKSQKSSLPSNANVTCCFLLMSRKVKLIVYFKRRCHAEPHGQERHTKQMLGELHGPSHRSTVRKFIDTNMLGYHMLPEKLQRNSAFVLQAS